MSNYRNPIGFKVTDNKLATLGLCEEETSNNDTFPPADRLRNLLRIADLIDEAMQQLASGQARHEPFSGVHGHKIKAKLDKLYIKHYEPDF